MRLVKQALRLGYQVVRLLGTQHLAVERGAIQSCLDLRGERITLRG